MLGCVFSLKYGMLYGFTSTTVYLYLPRGFAIRLTAFTNVYSKAVPYLVPRHVPRAATMARPGVCCRGAWVGLGRRQHLATDSAVTVAVVKRTVATEPFTAHQAPFLGLKLCLQQLSDRALVSPLADAARVGSRK